MERESRGQQGTVARVAITDRAAEVLRGLMAEHGPLLFHQSGGCCDGSSPMCFPRGEFRIGQRDVLLGELEGTPFYIGGQQYEVWKHTQLLIDVVPGWTRIDCSNEAFTAVASTGVPW